jgi:hypothetical protein
MNKQHQKNYPAVIAFMIALVAGPAALFSVLGNEVPTIVTVSVIIYVASTIAVWYFENTRGK